MHRELIGESFPFLYLKFLNFFVFIFFREGGPIFKSLADRPCINNEPYNNILQESYLSNQLDSFLSLYSREAREIALCLRETLLEIFPNAKEQIDLQSGIIAYGYDSTYKGLVFAIAPHMKHVSLMISRGTSISDPDRLLAGTGKQARHIKFKSQEETENPALRRLLKNALTLNYKD